METASGTRGATIYRRPVELLQNLIRFDTTNPPGNEGACIAYIDQILNAAGFETLLLARDRDRPNLVTRLSGGGSAPPLLMYGHIDVVTTHGQAWTRPPFEAEIADGYIWGRGALDMKSGVAMMMAALMRARAEDLVPPGDVVLAIVADEEAGGACGARYLVDAHPELFEGIRFAIGEAGGFSVHIAGQKLYPIMVAEKQICWLKATVRGQGGHGASPVHGEAMAKLARLLETLDQQRLPAHVTVGARSMIEQIASQLPTMQGRILRQLLNPRWTDRLLGLLGPVGETMDPLLHNTVSPTILHGSKKVNVIPEEVSVELDGRLLPGYAAEDMLAELAALVGSDVELEVMSHEPGPSEPDLGLFATLADILQQADPGGFPMPMLVGGVTDARHFSRLGIQTYGFTPMKTPPGFDYYRLAHCADERIPVEALDFGIEAIYELLQRFGEAA